jgi:hypothetical protein
MVTRKLVIVMVPLRLEEDMEAHMKIENVHVPQMVLHPPPDREGENAGTSGEIGSTILDKGLDRLLRGVFELEEDGVKELSFVHMLRSITEDGYSIGHSPR